jgi:hypothetical protein
VKFDEAVELDMACLVQGHFEAGMKGKLRVTAGDENVSATTSAKASPASHEHDHSQHKH